MIEKKDVINDKQTEKIDSSIGSMHEVLLNFKKELEKQNNDSESLSIVDRSLLQLTQHVTERYNYESEKIEQIVQKHPELATLMNSVVNNKNAQNESNESFKDLKSLVNDLLHSIIASLNKQIDEESVK
ncbi:hypothetical protein KA405_02235 [Patescibacteria group bacterium]|nr:hypothetical protein [Patescibacteria group bacterium]